MTWIGQYILDEHGNPVPEPDTLKWAIWFEHHNRIVRQDRIDDVRVSTVFLGLDHAYLLTAHLPVLWETMIFGGPEDQYQRRYTSREDALQGHMEAMMLVEPRSKDLAELRRMMETEPEWARKAKGVQ